MTSPAAPSAPSPAPRTDPIARLLADLDAGRSAAVARAVSIVENHRPGFDRLLGPLASPLAGLLGMGRAGAGARGVPVVVTVRDGRVMLGPLRIGTAPPLY